MIISLILNLLYQWLQLLFKYHLTYIISSVQEEINLHYKFKISYYNALAAKQKILEELFGTHEDSFEILPRLFVALQESNSGTIIEWKHNG